MLHTLHDTVLEEDRRFTIQLIPTDEVEISPVKGKRNSHVWKLESRYSGKYNQIMSSYKVRFYNY